MLNKLAKDSYQYRPETDPEEFRSRVYKLQLCITNYVKLNKEVGQMEKDLRRMDVNTICQREMHYLREFINNTDARYENVYAPVNENLKRLIQGGNSV